MLHAMCIKICTVVTGNTINKFLANLAKAQKLSSFVELRVDFINNLQLDDIEIIKENTYQKSIFTCRARNEGGNFQKSEQNRISIIKEALKLGFDYVDIELSAIRNLKSLKKSSKTKIICSYHDFRKTQSYEKLEEIANKMKENINCDIIKIVTMVRTQADNQKLSRLLINKDKKQKMIVLGMGELGKITRILSPLLGGYLTFASFGKIKSAPGQIDAKELENIYKALN